MNASRFLALILGLTLAFQACAYENLVGEYMGKISSVEGYSGNVGDSCAVVVGTSNMYGGSLVFEIPGFDKILMETRNMEKAFKHKSDTVKLHTPGSSGKPAETVVMKLGGDGGMQSLMLKRFWNQQHQGKSVTCGDLSKK